MATYDEIGVLVNGSVENVDLATNIFSFGTIRFGASDITVIRGERLVDLVTGQEADAANYHTHDSQYFTKTELGDDGSLLAGTEVIGYDTTHAWSAITPSTGFLQEFLEQVDNQLANISTEFSETAFRVTQTGDVTAKLAFDISAVSTGETRTIIMPDGDINLGNITTTDYVDNAVNLAISGLSAKPACQLATRPKDWLPFPSNDYFGIKTNATVDNLLDGEWFRIYRAPNAGGGNWVFWFSEGTTTVAPTTGTLGTHKIDVNTSDTQEVAFAKMVAVIEPILNTEYDVFPFPLGDAAIGDVQIKNKTNGLTPAIEVSNSFVIAVNKIDSYGTSYTRGFDGVGYSLTGPTLTITGMRSNFLNTAPIIDGEEAVDIGYRILIKDMPTIDNRYNGIWEVTGVPTINSMELQRPPDSDGLSGFPESAVFSEVAEGNYTFITQGETNGSRGFIMITPGLLVVNSNGQEWTQFLSVQQIVPNLDTYVYPFVEIDDFQRINIGPLTQGQMIAGSDRNDPAPVNTLSSLSDIFCNIDSDGVGGLEIKDDRIVDSMVKTGTTLQESLDFFNATDISGAEAETLTDGSNADALHIHNTTNVTEGTNLYFTEARVRVTPLTGLNTALTGDLVATDTTIQAFGKIQNAISNNLEPNKLNVEMDNLSNVAINTDLLPDTDNSIDLGSASLKFKDGYFAGKLTVDGGIDPIYLQFSGLGNDTLVLDGALWALNDVDATLRYKDGQGVSDDIVLKVISQTLENKTMDFTAATGNNTITISTLEVTENTNLYYTQGRFDSAFTAKSTTDLSEGTNLYYTDTRVQTYINTRKAIANGLASLDGGGKIPTAQLPDSVLGNLQYQGTWDADTNTPTLTSSTGTQGHYYVVSVAGNTSLDGESDWQLGDWVIFNGSVWEKADNTNLIDSVNGFTGTVVLTTTDIAEGTNLYYTQARFNSAFTAKSTTDLSEGTNLYYTDERVDDRVSVLIQNGTGISWAYDDGAGTLTPTIAITSFDTDDLSEGATNLYYTQTRFDSAFTAKDTDDLSEGVTNLYFTDERVDDRVAALIQNGTGISWTYDDISNTLTPSVSLASFSTNDLSEGTNLYYTQTRFDSAFTAKSTTDLSEGTNLYYTQTRFDSAFTAKDTDDLSEGVTNLYFTEARAYGSTLNTYVKSSGTVSNTDTVLTAIEKIDGNTDIWPGGTTGSRPGSPVAYQRFFDTTLGQPIWYDGVNWVDATGTTV